MKIILPIEVYLFWYQIQPNIQSSMKRGRHLHPRSTERQIPAMLLSWQVGMRDSWSRKLEPLKHLWQECYAENNTNSTSVTAAML